MRIATGIFIVISGVLFLPLEHSHAGSKTEPELHTEAPWTASAELGFVRTSGNTSSESANVGINTRYLGEKWEAEFNTTAYRAKNEGVESSNTLSASVFTKRAFSDKSYGFASLSYLDDEFDGFTARSSAALGLGYTFFKQKGLTWDLGVGLGYLNSSEIQSVPSAGEAGVESQNLSISGTTLVGRSELVWQLTENTRFEDDFVIEAGSSNTYYQNSAALSVDMNSHFSLKLELLTRKNSKVEAPRKRTDNITLLSLVYSL